MSSSLEEKIKALVDSRTQPPTGVKRFDFSSPEMRAEIIAILKAQAACRARIIRFPLWGR
jgi:hypothetical protein